MSSRKRQPGLALLCCLLASCAAGPRTPVAGQAAAGQPAQAQRSPTPQPSPEPSTSTARAASASPAAPRLEPQAAAVAPSAPATQATHAAPRTQTPQAAPTTQAAQSTQAAPVTQSPQAAPGTQAAQTTQSTPATQAAPAIAAPAPAPSSQPKALSAPPDAVSAAAAKPPAQPPLAAPPPSSLGATPSSTPPRLAPEPSAYLRRALAELESAPLPEGGRLIVKRSPGSERGAAVIALPGLLEREGPDKRGLAAFALGLAAEGGAGRPAGELARLLRDSGGSLSLAELGGNDSGGACLGLLVEAPRSELGGLLSALDAALSAPAFLGEGFPQSRAEAVLRELRLAERLRSRDPVEAARSRLGLPASSLGGREGLGSLSLPEARAFWGSRAPRRDILVLADIDAAGLAGIFASRIASGAVLEGQTPIKAPGARAAEPPPGVLASPAPSKRLDPGLLLAFRAPRSRDREAAALLVALELVAELARSEAGAEGRGAVEPPLFSFLDGDGLGLIGAGGGKGSLSRKELESALERLGSSLAALQGDAPRAEGPASAQLLSAAQRLEAAKARALTRAYGGLDRKQIALALASELVAGGDGSAFYRFEGLIQAVRLEELEASIRRWLAPEKLVWLESRP